MLDFGEELTVETFKIPWLIWIQIVVLILLMILLYCCSLFPLDLSQEHTCDASTSSSSGSGSGSGSSLAPVIIKQNSTLVNHLQQPSQRGGRSSRKREIVASTSSSRRMVVGEVITESESASAKEASDSISSHPCHYFRLAKIAFLKCLGLDCSSEDSSSSSSEHKNDR